MRSKGHFQGRLGLHVQARKKSYPVYVDCSGEVNRANSAGLSCEKVIGSHCPWGGGITAFETPEEKKNPWDSSVISDGNWFILG